LQPFDGDRSKRFSEDGASVQDVYSRTDPMRFADYQY
jgi:hypothetical protein